MGWVDPKGWVGLGPGSEKVGLVCGSKVFTLRRVALGWVEEI